MRKKEHDIQTFQYQNKKRTSTTEIVIELKLHEEYNIEFIHIIG